MRIEDAIEDEIDDGIKDGRVVGTWYDGMTRTKVERTTAMT